jgi:hypothetical protein
MYRRRSRPTPTEHGQPVFVKVSDDSVHTYEQRQRQGEAAHMARFVGTGKDPRYPEGVVVDIMSAEDAYGPGNKSELDLVEKGYVVAADPYQDPGRTPSQIAAAVIRGDTLSDPYDASVAVKEGFVDDAGQPTARAYDVVHEDKQEAVDEGRGEAGGPVRGVLSAVAAHQRDGLAETPEGAADTADTDIAAVSQDELPVGDYESSDQESSKQGASKASGNSGSKPADEKPAPSKGSEKS